MRWPSQHTVSMDMFYGTPGENLVMVTPPYRMVDAWDTSKQVHQFPFNRKCFVALEACLKGILDLYKTQEAIEHVGMHLFGGSFVKRPIAGSHMLSTHSWGAAIDLDPVHNGMGEHLWSMPAAVVEIFEAQGATWGGHWKHRPDAMHFQFAYVP